MRQASLMPASFRLPGPPRSNWRRMGRAHHPGDLLRAGHCALCSGARGGSPAARHHRPLERAAADAGVGRLPAHLRRARGVTPGHRELLAVLWDLRILPELRVLPMPMRQNYAWLPEPTREQIMGRALRVVQWHGNVDLAQAQGLLEAHFDDLFVHDAMGYRPHWPDTVREWLITWEPSR